VKRSHAVVLVLAAVVVGVHLGARPVGDVEVSPEARRYYGAMTVYGRIARWAGHRALEAETAYWEAVQP
jgi:hypothetical protein